ncbi:MAG: hypothetical protein HYX24_04380 [Candidatus Aenigmarchaeota archaeon]|nr:hypothetical protein [Candidatus Aenigmarchaeota archaeon]
MHYRLLSVITAFAILLSPLAFALQPAPCFDYYRYGELKFDWFHPEKIAYNAGEQLIGKVELKNTLPYPIAQGNIKVFVLYRGEKDIDTIYGDEIIDEFFLPEEVNLRPGETYKAGFTWEIPGDAKPGVYALNAYLMETTNFNLAGLAFTTSTPAATSTFTIKNSGSYVVTGLDRPSIAINGKKYAERTFVPFFSPGETITITASMAGDADMLDKELYSWDDNSGTLLSGENEEDLKKGQKVSFMLPGLKEGAYLAKFTSIRDGSASIQLVRFAIPGNVPRIQHTGLDRFPLRKGEKATLHICATNSAGQAGDPRQIDTTIDISLNDRNGKVLFSDSYTGKISSDVHGFTAEFASPSDLCFASIEAKMASGSSIQQTAHVYDASEFTSGQKNDIQLTGGVSGGRLAYRAIATGAGGCPAGGEMIYYILDGNGNVAKWAKGRASGEIDTAGLPKGAYTLKATDETGAVAEMPFEVAVEDKKDNTMLFIIIGAIAVIAFAAMVFMAVRKKEK